MSGRSSQGTDAIRSRVGRMISPTDPPITQQRAPDLMVARAWSSAHGPCALPGRSETPRAGYGFTPSRPFWIPERFQLTRMHDEVWEGAVITYYCRFDRRMAVGGRRCLAAGGDS